MRPLSLIVAIARNGVIGQAGGLPWNYPEDRRHFEATTSGHAVLMGRRTWEETGRALEGRHNIVVSRRLEVPAEVRRASTLQEGLEIAWGLDPEPFVIGGVRLFEEAMPRVTRAFVSEIPEAPEGDTFFRFDPRGFRLESERVAGRVTIREYVRIS
jgi:dihydrofolate reductase